MPLLENVCLVFIVSLHIFSFSFISDNKQSWSAISPWNKNNKAISTWFIGSVDGYRVYLELLSGGGGSGPVLEG